MPIVDKLDLEVEFGEVLGDYFLSTPEQDMREHWDVAIKYDVKSIPSDPSMKDLRWVEIINVRGDDGWIRGKADYIAFEHGQYWIVVKRDTLDKWVTSHLTNKIVSQDEWRRNPEPYNLYGRAGRQDLITLVPVMDLCYLGRVLKRNKAVAKADANDRG